MNPLNRFRIIVLATFIALIAGCTSGKLEPDFCSANIECGPGACVLGECVTQAADCRSLGTFVDISTQSFDGIEQMEEIHMTIDNSGAVHYCYSGFSANGYVSRYGRQTGISTFDEVDIRVANGEPASCGAISLSSTGVPYVISRIQPSFVYYEDGKWFRRTFDALQGDDGKGAVASEQTIIHLTPDALGGMYASMSLGINVSRQPLYIAYINDGVVTEILNGWQENGESDLTGYAPQMISISKDGASYFVTDNQSHSMRWQNFDGGVFSQTEGFYATVARGVQGVFAVAYLDRNFTLQVAELTSGFTGIASVGQVDLGANLNGRIPFTIALDRSNDAHLLVEDVTQGYGVLSYYKVNSQGQVSDAQLVANDVVPELPGMQQYAIGTDICGRPTIAFAEYEVESDDITGTSSIKPVLRIREGY